MSSSVGASEVNMKQLHSDVMRGNWSKIIEMYKQERAVRIAKITGTGDTVLHVAVSKGQQKVVANMVDLFVLVEESSDVEVTVDREDINIILGAENERRNTPLHLAAIIGNVEMCKKIGGTNPSLIARRNIVGETPLFLAALYGWKEAFLWLHYLYIGSPGVSSTDVAHCVRDNDDTILHCAIVEGHIDVAIEILHLYTDLVKGMRRNKEGLSLLHLLAAKRLAFKSTKLLDVPILFHPIYWLWKVEEKHQATTLEELQKKNQSNISIKFIKVIKVIKFIHRRLRFLLFFLLSLFCVPALARFLYCIPKMKENHVRAHQIMTKLLQYASDEDMSQIISRTTSEQFSISLQTEENNESEPMASGTITIETPLMIAAKNGVTEMVEKILELFPSRIKDVNAEGKNILLLAVEYRQTKVFNFLCKQKWLTESLFRQVDKEGNNALHLAAGLGVEPDCLNAREKLSMETEINWFVFVTRSMPRGLWGRYNKKMKDPYDIFVESHKELMKSEGQWAAKTSEACSVVSTLVVSVAYATRTNVPGGYDDNGYAILRNKSPEFKTFNVFSFVALLFSIISTICFLSIVASHSQFTHSWRYVPSKFYFGVYFMFASIVCLWISFCAADFFMLNDDSQKLHKALPTYILLSLVIIFMVVSQLPTFLGLKLSCILWTPPSRRKYTSPIEYRRTKNKEKGTDLNHQN